MIRTFDPFVLNDYPTSDGRPMAETDWHRDLMLELIETLKLHYAADPDIYVSGNLLIYYEPGNKRRHVSPDVFVVRGVPNGSRPNYLIWEEGKAPEVVIELTSSSTRREDVDKKFKLYRDVLKVKEYFLFDPREDYLEPPMRGYRLVGGEYRPIRPKDGRLPSRILGMHLERNGLILRIWNPETGRWLPTPNERADEAEGRAGEAEERAATIAARAAAAEERLEIQQRATEEARAEVERLRQLIANRDTKTNGTNGANGHR